MLPNKASLEYWLKKIVKINGKDTTPFLPLTYNSCTSVDSQMNWVTLIKRLMQPIWHSEKLSYYFYDARVTMVTTHLCKFLTVHTLNSKEINWGTEIASMNHATFEHIRETENILADCISHLRSMGLYKLLDHEEGGRNLNISSSVNYPPSQLNRKGWIHL